MIEWCCLNLASRCCLKERQGHQAFAKSGTEGEFHRILIYAAPGIIGGRVILELRVEQSSKGNCRILVVEHSCLCGFHGYCGCTWNFSSPESLLDLAFPP